MIHVTKLFLVCQWLVQFPNLLHEINHSPKSGLLSLSHLPSVHSVIVMSLQPPIHLTKIGGLTPISLSHLSSWFSGPPICVSNLSLVPLKCQCRGASMYLLAMDFPWNVPFSVHPARSVF